MERLVTRCLGCVQKSRRTRLREAFLTQGRRSIRLPKVRQRALFLERYRSSAVAATVNIFTLKGTPREASRLSTGGTIRSAAERLGLTFGSLKGHLQRARRTQNEALFDWQRDSD